MEEDKSNPKLQMQRLRRKSLLAYLVSGNLQELLEDLFPPNLSHIHHRETTIQGFPGGAVVESLPANAGHTGSSPGLGRSHMPRST